MPSEQHELPLHMMEKRPELVLKILSDVLDIDVPNYDAFIPAKQDVSVFHPAERRCDGTVLLGESGKNVFGVVVESQTGSDKKKLLTWPTYVSNFRDRYACPTALLVFCPNERIAQKWAVPIELGPPGSRIVPLTVSPERLPPVTDAAEAQRMPELAVLATPVHADSPQGKDVIKALCAALDVLDRDTGKLYHDYVASRLSEGARKLLEEMMKLEEYEWQSDFAIQHQAKGRAEGEAHAILVVLQSRGIHVSDDARERITGCTDKEQLERWLKRTAKVQSADELFD